MCLWRTDERVANWRGCVLGEGEGRRSEARANWRPAPMATFITPATVAKWDDSKRTNFAEHVAAKVALADPRDACACPQALSRRWRPCTSGVDSRQRHVKNMRNGSGSAGAEKAQDCRPGSLSGSPHAGSADWHLFHSARMRPADCDGVAGFAVGLVGMQPGRRPPYAWL